MNKKEQVKEKIGKVAMKCFARYGLDKTTLDDIAKEVGLNKASLYYYYKNKEDIFLEVAITEGRDYLRTLEEHVLEKKTTEARIIFYLVERVNYLKNVLNMNRVSAETVNRMLPKFFELFDAVTKQEIQFHAKIIREGIKRGELRNTDAAKLASSLINMNDAMKHHVEHKAILKNQDQIDYRAVIKEMKLLVSLIFQGLTK